ncbi:rhomboid family intramembrane serine protease [Actinomyces minihominis]|uniref:rhomboid family intramembrane serine protease n=1 Tax=Actinomyces minihominis TaxID=2002838 RepID=UPI000C07B816|nr:rhomboid family intramembrane serine protease [Actinomyces minihominis]
MPDQVFPTPDSKPTGSPVADAIVLSEENVEVEAELRPSRLSQWLSSATSLARRFGSWVVSGPVSLVLAILLVAVRVVGQAFPSLGMEGLVAASTGSPWWTVFTYILWATTWIHVVVDVVLLLSLGIWVERRIGSRDYAIIGLLSAWVGSLLTLGVAWLITDLDHQWGQMLALQTSSGMTAFLVGAALALSIRLDTLWRRRVQIIALTVLGVFVLFSGSINAVTALVAALVGWGIGVILWGKQRDRRPLTGTRREGRVLVAAIVAGVVIGTLLSLRSTEMVGALANLRGDLLTDVSPGEVETICATDGLASQCANLSYMLRSTGFAARLMTILPLLVQLVLAWGLRGGRRAAFWGTIILQGGAAAIAAAHLIIVRSKVHGWEAAAGALGLEGTGVLTANFIVPIVVPLVLLLLVIASYPMFTVRAPRGAYRRFWAWIGGLTAVALIAYLIVGMIMRNTFTPEATFFGLIGDFALRLLPAPALYLITPHLLSDSWFLTRFSDWLALIPWVAAVILLLKAFTKRDVASALAQERYKEIVKATDAGTMAWMSTWDGNLFWESPTREAAIAYRADGGVALTVTDPAAHPEDLEHVMKEFAEFCSAQDLIPAFYSVHPKTADIASSWGWPRLQVAEETILNLDGLAFTGKAFQNVRTALNRAKKEGINPVWGYWSETPMDLRMQVEAMSEEWASDKGLPEMGFTLGGVKELDDPDVPILLAVDEGGKMHGATSWMPVYEGGEIIGWTLDFMRRREDGFRPVMEYMIAQAALEAQRRGYRIVSLSGAPLAKAQTSDRGAPEGEDVEGSSSAALDFILEILGKGLEPVYGFRSLLQFKAKFKPAYEPVYLCLPDVGSLATVGLAIGHAYVPHMSIGETARLAKTISGH